jgi:peptidoglycan L-alanyl-D-glutamate endopeptidase CwlK
MFKRLKRFFSRFKRFKPKPKPKPTPRLRFALDPRTKKNIKSLNEKVQPVFIQLMQIAKAKGQQYGGPKCEVKAISGFRSYSEQQKLYNQGRTTKGNIVTYAKPGYSNHNFGLSLDLAIFIDGKYMDSVDSKFVYKVYKSIATESDVQGLPIMWGGNFKRFVDSPHFEYFSGLTMAEMRRRVSLGEPIIS